MRARAAAYAGAIVGRPWSADGLGPESYSCWGLVRAVERDVFGRELPIVNIDTTNALAIGRALRGHPLMELWPQVGGAKRHGDVVTMTSPASPGHVGVYLDVDRGGVLHAVEGAGVRFDRFDLLKALGWGVTRYFRPAAEDAQ